MFPQTVVTPVEIDTTTIEPIKKIATQAIEKANALAATPQTERPREWVLSEVGKALEVARNEINEYLPPQIEKLQKQIPDLQKATLSKFSPSEAEAPVLNYQTTIIMGLARRWDGRQAAEYWNHAIETNDRPTLKVLSDVIPFLDGVDSDGKRISLAEDFRIPALREKTKLMLMSDTQRKAAEKLQEIDLTIRGLRSASIQSLDKLGPRFAIERNTFVNSDDYARRIKGQY